MYALNFFLFLCGIERSIAQKPLTLTRQARYHPNELLIRDEF